MPEENYGNLGVTVPAKLDKPIAINPALKTFADTIGAGKGKGSLLIAQNTGGALFKAMKGDATLAEDGTLTLTNQSAHFWSGAADLTRTNAVQGSFSTPIKVELPRILPHQTLMIVCRAILAVPGSGESSTIALVAGGKTLCTGTQVGEAGTTLYWPWVISPSASGIASLVKQPGEGSLNLAEVNSQITKQEEGFWTRTYGDAAPFKNGKNEVKPLTVELQGSSTGGGTATVRGVYLAAWVVA